MHVMKTSCACRENQLHRVKNHIRQDMNMTLKLEYDGIVANTGEPLIGRQKGPDEIGR
jgi:hypothetical protein